MKRLITLVLTITLFACGNNQQNEVETVHEDSQASNTKDIVELVDNNTSWPMTVEGLFEETNSEDAGGTDLHVYGSISSSEDSYIMVYTMSSILKRNGVSDGDQVTAKIRPSKMGVDEYYDIVSISKK
ncbi:MAG: hypothetical protein HWE27_14190 [Gammaproteobacteria bacterium]|nr:hypothetical protein [Gammaproteobacteria bacterium]